MSILITGGFGFLGTHLIERLLADDPSARIHVIDNLSTTATIPADFHASLGSPTNLTWESIDLHEYLHRWSPVLPLPPYTHIYHLASPVGPAGILAHTGRIVEDVVSAAYGLAELATRSGARLLDVSTSEVYGGGQHGLCSESMPKIVSATTTPRLEYAVAKLAAETALINLAKTTRLDVVIVRPFNIAGPRQSPRGGFVLPRFVNQAIENLPLTVFGAGTAQRAFTHAQDVASGLILAMLRGRSGQAYNIGNPSNRTSILGLAHRVIDLANSTSTIEHVDPTTIFGPLYAEADDKFPDPTLAETELGWRPRRDLIFTIIDTIKWTRKLPLSPLPKKASF